MNKNYEIHADKVKSKSGKLQSAGRPGQAAYYVAQGLSEHQKAKSQKESLVQQVEQDNQNQQGNIADGVKKEAESNYKIVQVDVFSGFPECFSQRACLSPSNYQDLFPIL